jgi:hypothetical protein
MPDMNRESQESPPDPSREHAPAPGSEARRRAAAYLDLWERQLAQTASEGLAQPRPRAGGRRG